MPAARAGAKHNLDYAAIAARLRLAQVCLDISDREAAAAHGVKLRTYRRSPAGGRQRAFGFADFCERYAVSLDWYIAGDLRSLKPRLTCNRGGKVAILKRPAA